MELYCVNLSHNKRGWDDRWEEFSIWAGKGIALPKTLLELVDEDTNSFNKIMDAFRLPKESEEDKTKRKQANSEQQNMLFSLLLRLWKLLIIQWKSWETC